MTTAIQTRLTFDDVFSYPEYALRGVPDWASVAKLGSNNIGALVSRARNHEHSLTASISKLKDEQAVLRKAIRDFEAMASEYSNPTITEIGMRSGSFGDNLEPLDAESAARPAGATTFNMCGWCKHTSGGTARFNYLITTSCSLLGYTSPETRFNTPCLLRFMKPEEITAQVDQIEGEIKNTLAKREKVREGIKFLLHLKIEATEKPYLVSLRPHDLFDLGDEIVVYIGQWNQKNSEYKSLIEDGAVWVPATVVNGYRHHDGIVNYRAALPLHNNMDNEEGRGGFAGMSRPEAMLRSEFNYLESGDLDFLDMWIANVDDHLKGFDGAQFLRDLIDGKIAKAPVEPA
jgi:hypothetical protein